MSSGPRHLGVGPWASTKSPRDKPTIRMMAVLVAIMLATPLPIARCDPADGGAGDGGPLQPLGDRAQHDPIEIHSNLELVTMARTEGWRGTGTAGNPYVIEGYDINASGGGFCILVGNVTAHLVIANNTLHHVALNDDAVWQNAHVATYMCTNVTIRDNHFGPSEWVGVFVPLSIASVVNNTFDDVVAGVVGAMSQCTAERNVMTRTPLGIIVEECNDAVIRDNRVSGVEMAGYGVVVYYSDRALVANNTIDDQFIAMEVYRSEFLEAVDNTITDSYAGIYLERSNEPDLTNNPVSTEYLGILVGSSDNATLTDNVVNAGMYGVIIDYSERCRLRDNVMLRTGITLSGGSTERGYWNTHDIDTSNTLNGLPVIYRIQYWGGTVVEDVGQLILVECRNYRLVDRVLPAGFGGVQLAFTDGFVVSNTTMRCAYNATVQWFCSSDVDIVGNDLGRVAVLCDQGSNNSSVRGNVLEGGHIWMTGEDNVIANNTVTTDESLGIQVRRAVNVDVLNNDVTMLDATLGTSAIYVSYSRWTTLRDNTMTGANIDLYGGDLEDWNTHDWDASNTFEGLPVLYRCNATVAIDGGEYAAVLLANCTNSTVRDLVMDRGDQLVRLAWCDGGAVTRNIFRGHYIAIGMRNCEGVEVTKNELSGGEVAMVVGSARDLTIEGNYITDHVEDAIYVWNQWNLSVSRNLVRNCSFGVYIDYAMETCEVSYNIIEDCTAHAVNLWGRNFTTHHNMFTGNNRSEESGLIEGSQCYGDGYDLSWDDGSEGNYWSDYVDKHPTATNDGVTWDQPYVVDGDEDMQDDHPLVAWSDTVPPIARAGARSIKVDPGATVQLSAAASIDNVGVTSVSWHFVYDGAPVDLAGVEMSHTFDLPGRYVVTLNVSDAAGNVDEVTVDVRVGDIDPPVAVAGEDVTVDQGQTVTFDGSASSANRTYARFAWDFVYGGAPVTLDGEVTSFTFDTPGVYRVTLTVGLLGYISTDGLVVTVRDVEGPQIDIGGDLTIDQGETVRLSTANCTDNVGIEALEWTVVGGTGPIRTSSETELVHTFLEPGVYTITLSATDAAGNNASRTITVVVRDTVPPRAYAGSDAVVDQGEEVTLSARDSTDNVGIVGYEWLILSVEGFVYRSSGVDLVYTFTEAGVFTVMLNVTDAAGNWDADTVIVTVRDTQPPEAVPGPERIVGQDMVVTFDGTNSTDNVGVVSWHWSFEYRGSECVLTGKTVTFTFHEPGSYLVTLTVKDAASNVGSTQYMLTVVDMTPPEPSAEVSSPVPVGGRATFDGRDSTDNVGIEQWVWSFEYNGRNVTLYEHTAEYTFDIPGEYDVNLTVYDAAGNSASIVLRLRVVDTESPVAVAALPERITEGRTITLDGTASTDNVGVVSWTWSFTYKGDLVTLEGPTATFKFDEPGTYMVQLVVKDLAGLQDVELCSIVVEERDVGGGAALWATLVVIVVVAVAAGVLLRTRTRARSGPAP